MKKCLLKSKCGSPGGPLPGGRPGLPLPGGGPFPGGPLPGPGGGGGPAPAPGGGGGAPPGGAGAPPGAPPLPPPSPASTFLRGSRTYDQCDTAKSKSYSYWLLALARYDLDFSMLKNFF